VLELARDFGFSVAERSLGRRDLFAADEVFLTGSGAGVIGVPAWTAKRHRPRRQTGEVTLDLERRHRALARAKGSHRVVTGTSVAGRSAAAAKDAEASA